MRSFYKNSKSAISLVLLLFAFLALSACETKITPHSKKNDKPTSVPADLPPATIGEEPNSLSSETGISNEKTITSFDNNTADMIRIAVLLPLSGNAEKVGNALRNAAIMAQYEVAPDNMILQFYDTKGTKEEAAFAAEQAISHGSHLIIGPLFSGSVNYVAQKARAYGIKVLTFSNDPIVIGNGVFSIGLMVEEQVDKIISFAYQNGHQSFAVIAPDNETGSTVVYAAKRTAEKLGVGVKEFYYDTATTDFSDFIKEVANYNANANTANLDGEYNETTLTQTNPFSAVLIADEGARLRSLAAMFPYYDMKVKILGTSMWDDSSVTRERALIGSWFPTLPKTINDAFQKRYEKNFGHKPPRVASLAYDAIALAAAISRNNTGKIFSTEEITSPNGFAGIDGIFRLYPSGHSERGLAITEVGLNGLLEIRPAPVTFEAETNIETGTTTETTIVE